MARKRKQTYSKKSTNLMVNAMTPCCRTKSEKEDLNCPFHKTWEMKSPVKEGRALHFAVPESLLLQTMDFSYATFCSLVTGVRVEKILGDSLYSS